MIGSHTTFDENGQAIYVRFSRVDGNIKILGAHRAGGKDCFGEITSNDMQRIKNEIKQKN